MIPSTLTPGWYRMRWSTWDFVCLVYHDGVTMVFKHPSGAVHAVADFQTASWTPSEFPSHNAADSTAAEQPLQPSARVGSSTTQARVLPTESCAVDGKREGVVAGSEIAGMMAMMVGVVCIVVTDFDPMLVMACVIACLLILICFELAKTFRASAPVMGSREAATSSAGARSLPQSSTTPGVSPIR